ncbi:basic salivary proline-rich protein 2-like isoform X2 [Phacochoerus africanus]|uniref:basic salivary proline-rich protein 2-like isoform X2 n=1 Tax=Phacochoerus africanus TaxID=41426 RepID=UPI001FD9F88D|nr:basic salivary proline-rich protein 2-like isoform X2 [Phacochoerus africanus]
MMPSSCALTAGSDMVARGTHDAWRAAARKRPGRPGPCALAGGGRARAPTVQSWPPEPLGPRARLNEWGRRAGAGAPRSPRPAPPPPPGRIRFPHPRSGLPVSHWLLRPPVKTEPGGLGPERPPRGQAESWAPDPNPPPPPAWPAPRGRRRTRPRLPPPGTPRCGQMWADVEARRRSGGGAERGSDSSPSLGLRVPSAGGFIYAAKQSWPPASRAQRLQGLSAQAGDRQDPSRLAKSQATRGERKSHVTQGGERGTPPATPYPNPPPPRSLLHPLGCVSQKAPGPPRTWGQGHSTLVTTARTTCHPQAPQPGPSSRQSKVFGFCPVRSRP